MREPPRQRQNRALPCKESLGFQLALQSPSNDRQVIKRQAVGAAIEHRELHLFGSADTVTVVPSQIRSSFSLYAREFAEVAPVRNSPLVTVVPSAVPMGTVEAYHVRMESPGRAEILRTTSLPWSATASL